MSLNLLVVLITVLCLFQSIFSLQMKQSNSPLAIAATWNFGEIAVDACINILLSGGSAIDAVEKGINAVELDNNDQYFVGVGGLPNRDGVMEFDAAIIDHDMRYGE